MIKTTEKDTFRPMERSEAPADACSRRFTQADYLRLMNDPKRKAAHDQARIAAKHENLTPRRCYEKAEWADFVPTTYLGDILQPVMHRSVSAQLANNTTIDTGLTFKYREFEHWQRAQRGAENTEFERHKGSRRLQETSYFTLGLRSYVTEEEMLDLPFSAQQLEMQTMGASIALERDLLWMDSLWRATEGDNADTFQNCLTSEAPLDLEGLHGVITWFRSPFEESLKTIKLTNPWAASDKKAKNVEGLMRLGMFRPSDVLLSPKRYFGIINSSFLQTQNIWQNSRILDTGELQVPLLGVNFWKCNMGHFVDPEDADSWVPTDDIIIVDRGIGGAGTINSRQSLQVRNWPQPEFRSEDFMIFCREGYAVQNRRGLVRVTEGNTSQ